MNGNRMTWPLVVMAAVIGAVAVASGSGVERALGALALAVAAGLAWTALRGRTQSGEPSGDQPLELQTPELSAGERVLPWIFFSAAVLIVVAMTAFTLWYLGLI